MSELCVSTRSGQLLRWQQAFPGGMIFSSLQALMPSLGSEATVWLHADALPEMPIGEAIRAIRETAPEARPVVLSCTPNRSDAMAAFKAGACGYCHALSAPQMLQQVALVVRNGGMWVGPDLMTSLIGVLGRTSPAETTSSEPAALQRLSSREREVALHVGAGASNKEIARILEITERTVKAHMGSIFEKLEIRDRLQLALLISRDS